MMPPPATDEPAAARDGAFEAHLQPAAAGWSFWTTVYVRSAGFPAAWVLELADSSSAARIDALHAQRAAVVGARDVLASAIKEARRSEPSWKPYERALKAAFRGEPVDLADARLADVCAAYNAAVASTARATGELQTSFAAGQHAIRERLAAFVVEPRFREAITWQNRSILPGLDSLLHGQDKISSKRRKNERLAASYLQRYCVKNDTIGFFGPAGWGRIGAGSGTVTVVPGADLLAARTVFFEYWGIDTLAHMLGQRGELRPWIVPRCSPRVRLDGRTLYHSGGVASDLPVEHAAVLAACTGDRTAREIAQAVRAEDAALTEADVLGLLDELVEQHVITMAFEIPTHTMRPERELRAMLDRIDDPVVRAPALAPLERLEHARDDVARAAGSAPSLHDALERLATTFHELTGEADTRLGGQTYAARTLVFETCRRDLELDLGGEVLTRLAAPLALLMQSARWFTFELARRYRAELHRIYREIQAEAGGEAVVDFLRFWTRVPALFPGSGARSITSDVVGELHARWARLFDLAARRDRASIAVACAELEPQVHAVFAAPCPGWPTARHHSPDVMIASRGPAELTRGDYQLVLGELHVAINTLTLPVAAAQFPGLDALLAGRERDLPAPGIAPVWSKRRVHTDYFSLSRHDLDLETADSRSPRPRERVLTPAMLIVTEDDGRLVVATRDGTPGGHRFDLIAFLEHHLVAEAHAQFSLVARAAHTPRLTVGDLIVSRERWMFAPEELSFSTEELGLDNWVAARAWAKQHGLPRCVFVKIPEETKPFYVDFDSPLYVDLLLRQVKRASVLAVTEMLPTVDQCWLGDADANRYTCELRLAMRDPEPWSASADRGAP